MKDIDGGLHPAVDGQSLDEDKDEVAGGFFLIQGRCKLHRKSTNHNKYSNMHHHHHLQYHLLMVLLLDEAQELWAPAFN